MGFGENDPPAASLKGLPILQHVRRDERSEFLEAFAFLGKSKQTIMAANNVYLAEEVLVARAKPRRCLP